MSNFGPDSLFLPHRVWKVKFIGESVDDCGGGYSESIAEMCDELQNGSLPLLIVTPNGRDESGSNRDCFILNPDAISPVHLSMFKFLGVLIGIAIRTGSPLSLNLAEPVWKQMAGKTNMVCCPVHPPPPPLPNKKIMDHPSVIGERNLEEQDLMIALVAKKNRSAELVCGEEHFNFFKE